MTDPLADKVWVSDDHDDETSATHPGEPAVPAPEGEAASGLPDQIPDAPADLEF